MALTQYKTLRYLLASVVAVAVNQVTLAMTFGILGWTALVANLVATAVATVPTYVLNRSWVWGRTGRSHLLREVLPFGVLAVLGLVLSSVTASGAEHVATAVSDRRSVQTVIVMAATLLTFGILWVLRFAILDKLLFPTVAEAAPAQAPVVKTRAGAASAVDASGGSRPPQASSR